MTGTHSSRLLALGITLPKPAAPLANYVPAVRSGALLFISGQLPMVDGKIAVTGKLGAGVSLEDGNAPRACAPSICWRRPLPRLMATSNASRAASSLAALWPAPLNSCSSRR